MLKFKELFESYPMGGDQRNFVGSKRNGPSGSDVFNGKSISFPLEGYEKADLEQAAKDFNVKIRHKYYDDFEISGAKKDIISFLKSLGIKPKIYNEYF